MDQRRPHPQAVRKETLSRRSALRAMGRWAIGGVLVGGAVGAAGATATVNNSQEKRPDSPKHTESKPAPESKSQLLEPSSKKDAQKKTLNEILSLSHKDPERVELEKKYVESARSLEEIDQGFWVIVDRNERNLLLHKRGQLRLNQQEGLTPLTPEKIKWATDNEIHPEALAICEGVYPKALEVMTRLQKTGVFGSGKKPYERLISPGGMAAITKEETACFILIGDHVAMDKFKDYPKELQALKILAQQLSQLTGLNYDPKNIPGSESGDIGFQMRPSTALEVLRDFQIIKEGFNIFDLESSTMGAYIYLASRGYDSQDPDQITKALTGWNAKLGREGNIAKLNSSYRNTFAT